MEISLISISLNLVIESNIPLTVSVHWKHASNERPYPSPPLSIPQPSKKNKDQALNRRNECSQRYVREAPLTCNLGMIQPKSNLKLS